MTDETYFDPIEADEKSGKDPETQPDAASGGKVPAPDNTPDETLAGNPPTDAVTEP